MGTMNISMPEPMREFVEMQAAQGNYSASEYVRHLIREEQQRKIAREREMLHQLLAISAKQLADGEGIHLTAEEFLRRSELKRRKKNG